MVYKLSIIIILLGFLVMSMGMKPQQEDADEWETWFESDFETKALAVNEGDLEFLSSPPQKAPPSLINKLNISQQSLEDGWVNLIQCHEQMDRVSSAQVLYHARRTRSIQVVSFHNIEKVWVHKNSVQMENISLGAKLCVQAEVKALYPNYDGSYSMRNGPFLRRFLDGYYPMKVTMDVTLPEDDLIFEAITPQEQDGFTVTHKKGHMQIDALFVGLLEIEVHFDAISDLANSNS